MLSYQHEYHFGNHADLLKHSTLALVLQALNEKPKPYTVIDAHAGSGRYSLADEKNQKTGEAADRITRVLRYFMEENSKNNAIYDYLLLCQRYAGEGFYPGSPEIARCFSRTGDKIILMELHPQEFSTLSVNMKLPVISGNGGASVSVHRRDSWEGIAALTPPEYKRGLLLIDPSYEEDSDYENAAKCAELMKKRWNTGIVCIWYPLLQHRKLEIATLKSRCANCVREGSDRGVLCAEFCVKSEEESGLYGSGMIVINPPWKLDEKLKNALDFLSRAIPESRFSVNELLN